jgi:hypothetical protein
MVKTTNDAYYSGTWCWKWINNVLSNDGVSLWLRRYFRFGFVILGHGFVISGYGI